MRPWESYGSDQIPHITLDFETTNKDKGDSRTPENRIVLTCAKANDGPLLLERPAWDLLRQNSGRSLILIAHNAKFELGWLNREGIDTTHWLPFDTLLAEYVLAGNRQWDLSLDATARRYGLGGKGRVIDRLMKAGVNPEEMPREMLEERVRWDVEKTSRLFDLQLPRLAAAGLLRVMFTRCALTPVLAHIETYGMGLDGPAVMAEYDRLVNRRAELRAELVAMAEGRKLKGPQLAEFVYDVLKFPEAKRDGKPIRTPSGGRITRADTLSGLPATTPEQKRFKTIYAEFNKADAALTKNLEFFKRVVEEQDGRFQASFNQSRTQTHRLSSSGRRTVFRDGKARSVQFQNFPREYKRLFRAPSGYVIAEADGAQLEFRVGGSLARDPQVLEDAVTGADIHRYTASVIFKKPENEVTSKERTAAKSRTFKPLYGGTKGTPREEAYYRAFQEKYRGLFDEQTRWTHTVLKEGMLKTASGLVFYWPDTKMTGRGWITNTPSIFNYPVQSFATAEIIPVSMIYTFWEAKRRGLDARIVNTVHDSVVAEVAEKDVDKYREVVIESFLDRTYKYILDVYGVDLYVPLGVEFCAGDRWGSGEKTLISRPPQWRKSGKEEATEVRSPAASGSLAGDYDRSGRLRRRSSEGEAVGRGLVCNPSG